MRDCDWLVAAHAQRAHGGILKDIVSKVSGLSVFIYHALNDWKYAPN